MSEMDQAVAPEPFFARPGVEVETLPIGPGVPLGIERVTNPRVGIGGAYGTWGACYDNVTLPGLVEQQLGYALSDETRMNLAELGFLYRHHIPPLAPEEHVVLEVQTAARLLRAAAAASGWQPAEVDAVLIGSTTPAADDQLERAAAQAGIPRSALKVSIHKACDGGVAGLNLALNPGLKSGSLPGRNLAAELLGKRVLVGGIEGLSRVLSATYDPQALQLFGNGAGVFGVIPGRTMKFLAGDAFETYDEEGLLQVRMSYPHSRRSGEGQSLLEATQIGENSFRVAGLQHEPKDGVGAVVMAGPMGMVKLFVRTGVMAVRRVYGAYRELMAQLGTSGRDICVTLAHHANYKINQLKARQLQREGITIPTPWLLNDFGNVSAASAMIAFLRRLPALAPAEHILFDGFGAGTYYDVVAVELGAGG